MEWLLKIKTKNKAHIINLIVFWEARYINNTICYIDLMRLYISVNGAVGEMELIN